MIFSVFVVSEEFAMSFFCFFFCFCLFKDTVLSLNRRVLYTDRNPFVFVFFFKNNAKEALYNCHNLFIITHSHIQKVTQKPFVLRKHVGERYEVLV